MKQSELKNIEHLSIYEEKEKFIHFHMEDGYVFTPYKEGESILTYYSSVCCYAPYMEEYPDYRAITVAEDEEYKKLLEEALEKEHKEDK